MSNRGCWSLRCAIIFKSPRPLSKTTHRSSSSDRLRRDANPEIVNSSCAAHRESLVRMHVLCAFKSWLPCIVRSNAVVLRVETWPVT